ncbi:MAG: LytTR family DNA-binding domain-containing protein [Ruminococcus sp.]|nr:LytTR family DNA-binding domain-containing protein [Ruminococcus sp.]
MFKVTVTQIDKDQEQEIVVRCHTINSEVVSIMEKLRQGDAVTLGTKDGKTYQISIRDIYYIESVDNKTYIYLQKDVYETKLKLYELEEQLKGTKLFRCAKAMILNIGKIRSVSPSVNSRFEARLLNGETVIISRQYVKSLKKLLGM